MKNTSLKILLSVLILLIGVRIGHSQESEFYQASQFYKNGQYKESIATYEHILKTGKTSGPLYYNLANSYFKDGQLGKAILNYKRAKKILPRDSDVDFNLNYALSQIKYKSEDKEKGFLKKLINKYSQALTLDEITKIILWSYFLVCAFIIFGLFLKWSLKQIIWPTGLFGVVLVLHICLLSGSINKNSQTIVVIEDIKAKFEPIEDSTVHYNLSEGNTATILEKRDGWAKIMRTDGKVGWTENHTIEFI